MNLQAAFENRWLFFDLGNTLIDEQAAQSSLRGEEGLRV